MPRLRFVVAWLAAAMLAVLAYVAGHGAASRTIQATNKNAAAQVAVAQRAMEAAQQDAQGLADERDLLEEDCRLVGECCPKFTSEQGTRQELIGKVVGVADGDTITVLDATKTMHRVRLLGIDAPENEQPYSARAKQALSAKVFGKDVRVGWVKRDKYKRVLGDVYADRAWVNRELVSEGFAWHFTQYDERTELATAEKEAREAKRGLWADPNPVPPWEARHPPPPAAQPYGPQALFWLNTSTDVRHNQKCRHFGNTKRGRFCGPNDGRPCGICKG